jgi:MFS family permease
MHSRTRVAPPQPTAERATDEAGSWVSLAVVSLGLFLAVISTTVVSVALPKLGRDLHASATQLERVVDAYVVLYASLLVAGGTLGDLLGLKGLFLAGVVLFAAGSLVAGLAPSIVTLMAGRVLQSLGPALLVPGSLTIIRAVFAEPRRGRYRLCGTPMSTVAMSAVTPTGRAWPRL